MTRTRFLSTAAAALAFGAASLTVAAAQTKPNPEPAPAAQQNAPPDKVAPPINAGEHKPLLPEVTGEAVKPPEPGHIKADENSNAELKAKDTGKASTTGRGGLHPVR